MARPWEYPVWRRVVMQIVMWLILGGSLGLAQLISVHNRNAAESMGEEVQIEGFQARLPEDWSIRPLNLHGIGGIEGQGVEAIDPEGHRVLQMVVLPLGPAGRLVGPGIGAASTPGQHVDFAGLHVSGIMRMESQVRPLRQGGSILERTITATASVPPDHVILIQLVTSGDQSPGRADARLVRDLAAGITASPAPNGNNDDDNRGS